jgi:hypothetical protein
MRPRLSLAPPPELPTLPVARLHGRAAAIERAQRSAVGAILLVGFWLLPAVALALAIVLST